MNSEELVKKNKEFTLASWKAQNTWNPLTAVRAEGIYFYGASNKKMISLQVHKLNDSLKSYHNANQGKF